MEIVSVNVLICYISSSNNKRACTPNFRRHQLNPPAQSAFRSRFTDAAASCTFWCASWALASWIQSLGIGGRVASPSAVFYSVCAMAMRILTRGAARVVSPVDTAARRKWLPRVPRSVWTRTLHNNKAKHPQQQTLIFKPTNLMHQHPHNQQCTN